MKKNQVRLTAVAMQFVFNHTTFDRRRDGPGGSGVVLLAGLDADGRRRLKWSVL